MVQIMGLLVERNGLEKHCHNLTHGCTVLCSQMAAEGAFSVLLKTPADSLEHLAEEGTLRVGEPVTRGKMRRRSSGHSAARLASDLATKGSSPLPSLG